jgi:uncharacterized protein (TIGR02145 family)
VDFSSGSYCHATASSCVYYSGDDPWEVDNGWEQCSGNDYYKSCNNSVWGTQQNNPQPSNAYCDAGGGAQTGYDLAATCSSGMTGGFTNLPCQSCFPYKTDSTSSCSRNSCTTNNHCWSTHSCLEGSCFQCGVDNIVYSGETYPTAQIGTQCWLAKNLNVGTMIPGTTNQANNAVIEKYCYNNDENNCTTYGGLYQRDEAMQYVITPGVRGICPAGWHLPTDAEWHVLENYYATGTCDPNRSNAWDCAPAGTELKSGGSSGFNVLFGGHRYTSGAFYGIGANTFLFSSTGGTIFRYMNAPDNWPGLGRWTYSSAYGYAVRCIKN